MCKTKLAKVFHFDLYGKREDKYEFLTKRTKREKLEFDNIL